MARQFPRHGEQPVDHQPLRAGQTGERALRQVALQGLAGAVDGAARQFQHASGLRAFLNRDFHYVVAVLLQGAPALGGKTGERGDRELSGRFERRTEAAVGSAAPHCRRHVGPHDRQDAVVADHLPLLDTVEKRGGGRGSSCDGVHRHRVTLDEIGTGLGAVVGVGPPHAGGRHIRCWNGPRAHEGIPPRHSATFSPTSSPSRTGTIVEMRRGSAAARRLNSRTPRAAGDWSLSSTAAP